MCVGGSTTTLIIPMVTYVTVAHYAYDVVNSHGDVISCFSLASLAWLVVCSLMYAIMDLCYGH